MCGIAGIVGTENNLPTAGAVDRMLDTVLHRGPDYNSTRQQQHIAFGHARLSILDLDARAHQPFATPDGAGLLIYNGEVYNHRALRTELEATGTRFATDCDTEVVLMALHTWGPDAAVERFDGMFALAYADLRSGTVWLARDRLGIKPLFTAEMGEQLLFASEQKAILAHPEFTGAIDEQSLLVLLTYERFNHTETPYRGIKNFLPGHLLRIRNGSREMTCFYDPVRDSNLQEIRNSSASLDESIKRFAANLENSVQAHLMSDVPVAALCSGGLDSGLVTAMAAKHHPQLHAYVADMYGMQHEEYRRARLITDHLNIPLRSIEVTPENFLTTLPFAIHANDQPLFFAQEVALMLIAEQMRADGIKVCLSGDGADELFGGYTWHAEAFRQWSNMALKARVIPNHPVFKRLGRFWSKLSPVDLDREIRRYALNTTPVEYVATSFNAVVTSGMVRTLRQRKLFDHFADLPLAERAFQARNFEDVYVHMRECLNCKDKMTMYHAIEGRPPFLENTVMEQGFNLPVSHKYHRRQRKILIRRTAAHWLPQSVLNLPKIGFTAPPVLWRGITAGLLTNGYLADLLKWPRQQMDEIVALLNTKPYYQFRLIGCEIWLRQFYDRTSPAETADYLQHIAQRLQKT